MDDRNFQFCETMMVEKEDLPMIFIPAKINLEEVKAQISDDTKNSLLNFDFEADIPIIRQSEMRNQRIGL